MWTQFRDMHSGGRRKEDWDCIYIEAPEKEAKVIFYHRFGHNPERVSCTCCGSDYSTTESESLAQATAYNRGCLWFKEKGYVEQSAFFTLEEYLHHDDVLIISSEEITDSERHGNVPRQGYVWIE